MTSTLAGEQHENNGEPIVHYPPDALPELCEQVYDKVEAFLNIDAKTERVRNVQQQSRRTLGVFEEALEKYRYADAVWVGCGNEVREADG